MVAWEICKFIILKKENIANTLLPKFKSEQDLTLERIWSWWHRSSCIEELCPCAAPPRVRECPTIRCPLHTWDSWTYSRRSTQTQGRWPVIASPPLSYQAYLKDKMINWNCYKRPQKGSLYLIFILSNVNVIHIYKKERKQRKKEINIKKKGVGDYSQFLTDCHYNKIQEKWT